MPARIFFHFQIFFLLVVGSIEAFAQQPADIANTLHALRQVKIEDQIGYDVPPQAIPLLTQLKHQLLHPIPGRSESRGSSSDGGYYPPTDAATVAKGRYPDRR
ncbi:MAG TPA: hypothetical protein VKY85_00765 [Candidatus Angelobacter sp.]|nr:hypothetical protein [Candidatus Angelobacter sp.]